MPLPAPLQLLHLAACAPGGVASAPARAVLPARAARTSTSWPASMSAAVRGGGQHRASVALVQFVACLSVRQVALARAVLASHS
ncbi:hypothetical protein, partial [Janthinobacterium sp. FW305-128]|uniref:hypothetical protein n=1 Tax=Janthinobacterium sp. FW305-128 TaxID=2775055 RepID=UPI001E4E778F